MNNNCQHDPIRYIIDFIESPYVDNFNYWDYRKSDNFLMTDLRRDKALELFMAKPSLLRRQDFNRLRRFFDNNDFKTLFDAHPRYFKDFYGQDFEL